MPSENSVKSPATSGLAVRSGPLSLDALAVVPTVSDWPGDQGVEFVEQMLAAPSLIGVKQPIRR